MYRVRLFAVRHSRLFEGFYTAFEAAIVRLDPVFRAIGYQRVEAPMAIIERSIKGVLFDCKMCGQCVLSSTGMSCPMNCPKQLRNGPCGGVRPGGFCEVMPEMRCVWVEAWDGAARMKHGAERIEVVQPPVNRELEGSSSWLRVAREKAAELREIRSSNDPSKLALAKAFDEARQIEPAAAPLAAEPKAAMSDSAVGERTSVYKAASAANPNGKQGEKS
ncbi:MAG: methylenetetrahydrofolate reductase C-terminal domain-containing protein [Aestuariivirgaceae bacterium]